MNDKAVALQIAAGVLDEVLAEDRNTFFQRVLEANYPLVTTDKFAELVEKELTDFVIEIRKGIDALDNAYLEGFEQGGGDVFNPKDRTVD